MINKERRQQVLKGIVERCPVSNQNQVVQLLRQEGFEATQAGVSRDLRELGLVKLNGRYVSTEVLSATGRAGPQGELSELIVSVQTAGANLIVVRTPPGAANAVAVELDRVQLPEIVGTVAGDDTFFIAVRSRAAQGKAVALLRAMMRRWPARPPERV